MEREEEERVGGAQSVALAYHPALRLGEAELLACLSPSPSP